MSSDDKHDLPLPSGSVFTEILTRLMCAADAGESIKPEEWIQRYPEFESELVEYFEKQQRMAEFLDPLTAQFTPPDKKRAGGIVAGRYKLLEEIGAGGMGTIWIAEQTKPLKRKVAIKFIKAGMDSKSVLARFDVERQALAVMDHPNIAKVLDAGLTDDDRPYFVMEYVKGVPITEYCDVNRLGVCDRLKLFVQVCSAVQHAHQKGIIHRDLKPSNILVAPYDGQPVPKVIDFGLAKAMHQSLTDRTLHTGHDLVLGTPLYMSPEQAQLNNLDIDTRTDVYALGVLLYELLTGTTPLERNRLKRAAWEEVKRIIREEEPPRPSNRLSSTGTLPSAAASRKMEPSSLTRLLRGELDWIVMKALEKERARRYETANGFALDVNRYLAGEPVLAHPPSTVYQIKKFVLRNQGLVLAVSLIGATLVAGIVGTSIGLWQAETARVAEAFERDRADAETQRAIEFRDRALDALRATTGTDVAKLIGEKKELSLNEREYLEAIAKRWQEFAMGTGSDAESLGYQAEGMLRVGSVWQQLGRLEEARTDLEQARDTLKDLHNKFPEAAQYKVQLATTCTRLGNVLAELDQSEEAQAEYRDARRLFRSLVDDYPEVNEYRAGFNSTYTHIGSLLADLGRTRDAHREYDPGIRLQRSLVQAFPDVPEYRVKLAETHDNLASLLANESKYEPAGKACKAALELRENLAADHPEVPEYREDLATTHNNLGLMLSNTGNYGDAKTQYQRGCQILEQLAGDYPAVPNFRKTLGATYHNLGMLLAALGQPDDAREEYERAHEVFKKLTDELPQLPQFQLGLASTHNNLGILLVSIGDREGACSEYKRAEKIQQKLANDFPDTPEYRAGLAGTKNNLALQLTQLGRSPEALAAYQSSRELLEELARNHPSVTRYQIELGGSYANWGKQLWHGDRAPEAKQWYDKAIDILTHVYEQDHQTIRLKQYLSSCLLDRSIILDQMQNHGEAEKDWERALQLMPPQEQLTLRASRASGLSSAGLTPKAVAEVEKLTKFSHWNSVELYNFACIYAVASGKSAENKQKYADRAMELLELAVVAGFEAVAHMNEDSDLDSIRDRDDFQVLIARLEENSNPK